MGSHAVLAALHPEGMGVVLALGTNDEMRLELEASTALLTPTSSCYHLTSRGGSIRLVVVVCTRHVTRTVGHQPVRQDVPTEGDTARGCAGGYGRNR